MVNFTHIYLVSDRIGGVIAIILNSFLIIAINKTTKGQYSYLVLVPATNDLVAAITQLCLQHVGQTVLLVTIDL